jgi:hypothetical protein
MDQEDKRQCSLLIANKLCCGVSYETSYQNLKVNKKKLLLICIISP